LKDRSASSWTLGADATSEVECGRILSAGSRTACGGSQIAVVDRECESGDFGSLVTRCCKKFVDPRIEMTGRSTASAGWRSAPVRGCSEDVGLLNEIVDHRIDCVDLFHESVDLFHESVDSQAVCVCRRTVSCSGFTEVASAHAAFERQR
jgi:hypothetical protein